MENGKTKVEDRHKGKFIGGYLTDEQISKIEAVEKLYDEILGEPGRNRTRAMRYILDTFQVEWLASFPKNLALKNMSAETNQ